MATVELLASGVVIVEQEPDISSFPVIPTAVLGIVGVTERGEFGGQLVQSFEEHVQEFGSFTASADATMASYGFFINGGVTAWVVRVVHYTDLTLPATKTSAQAAANVTTTGAQTAGSVTSGNVEPFFFLAAGTISVKVDGGGAVVATFDAAAGARTGVGGTYVTGFAGGETLQVAIDSGVTQTIAFTVGAQSLVNVIDEVNAPGTGLYGCTASQAGGELVITSDVLGTDSKVDVVGGTGAATLGMAIASTTGTGDVGNIRAVLATEVKTVIEADTTAQVTVGGTGDFTILTPTLGALGSIQVDAASTLDGAAYADLDNAVHAGTAAGAGTMGVVSGKTDGAWANGWAWRVAAASNGQSTYFDGSAVDANGIVQEVFPNLITTVADVDYWLTRLNSGSGASIYFSFTDSLAGTPPGNRPTNGDYTLAAGDDGLAGLVDGDFTGNSAGPTGLYQLDKVQNLTLLIVPGRTTSAVQNAMLTYCETWRNKQVFAILDPPTGLNAEDMVTYVNVTANLNGTSDAGAIYWPEIKTPNPAVSVFTSDAEGNITIPPSGWIAGVFAENDKRPTSVYQPPAGILHGKLNFCQGFATDEALDERKRGLIYSNNINPLTTEQGTPYFIDGTKTLRPSSSFPTIGQRRGASWIEMLLKQGLAFARHVNITKRLRRRIDKSIRLFLNGEMAIGAFATDVPATAYFVNVTDAINPPSVSAQKIVNVRVGLAFADPADWVVVTVGKDTRALDAELAQAAQGR